MLVAYSVAIDLVRQLRPIVEEIKVHDAHLADQLKRAATRAFRTSFLVAAGLALLALGAALALRDRNRS